MSCSARAGLSGSGYQTIPQWTTTSGSSPGRIREMTGLRMSASMNSVRSRSASGATVSMPARWDTAGSRSSVRASSRPQWLAIPAMTTRLPPAMANSLATPGLGFERVDPLGFASFATRFERASTRCSSARRSSREARRIPSIASTTRPATPAEASWAS